MPFCSLLDYVKPGRRTRVTRMSRRGITIRRSSACRPRFERLEERLPFSGTYTQTNLAADQPGVALVHDPELIEAWGISINPNGTFWVSARATDVSTVYSGDVTRPDGTFIPFVKSAADRDHVPGGGPTGQVFSGSATDFIVSAQAPPAPRRGSSSPGMEATSPAGTPVVPAPPPPPPSRNAQLMATTPGAVYTGLAIGNNGSGELPLRRRLQQRRDRRLRPDLYANRRWPAPSSIRPSPTATPPSTSGTSGASCTSPTPNKTTATPCPTAARASSASSTRTATS